MERRRTSWIDSGRSAHLVGIKTETRVASGLDPLLSIEDLAEYLGVPITTIYDWRVDGKGPCGVRVGRHVKFAVSDVRAWIDGQRESRPGNRSDER